MKKFLFTITFVLTIAFFAPGVVHAQTPTLDAASIIDLILKLAMGFGALAGIAALVAALINVLKLVGVVTDGTSGQWSAGLNLAAFVGLVLFGVFQPSLALEVLDGYAGKIAQVLVFVLGYLIQIFTSSAVHTQLSAMKFPLLGTSYTACRKG